MGCNPIVLVGQDAALTGGEFYASSSPFGGMRLASLGDDGARVLGDEAKVRVSKGGPVVYRAGQPVNVQPGLGIAVTWTSSL